MSFRDYLVGIIFAILLIWGPIDHSWPSYLLVRTGYLVSIPLLVWLILGWIWNYSKPSEKLEDNLKRMLSGLICAGLLIFTFFAATSKTHMGNTQWVRTRDGMEAVGDDIVLEGTDWGIVFILIFIAFLVLWFGVLKKGMKS